MQNHPTSSFFCLWIPAQISYLDLAQRFMLSLLRCWWGSPCTPLATWSRSWHHQRRRLWCFVRSGSAPSSSSIGSPLSYLVCHRQIWFASFFRSAPGFVHLRDSAVCFHDADFSWMMVFEALVTVQIRFSHFWSNFSQSFFFSNIDYCWSTFEASMFD